MNIFNLHSFIIIIFIIKIYFTLGIDYINTLTSSIDKK